MGMATLDGTVRVLLCNSRLPPGSFRDDSDNPEAGGVPSIVTDALIPGGFVPLLFGPVANRPMSDRGSTSR